MGQEPESVNAPGQSARVWANPKARMALLGVFGVVVLLVLWRVVAPPDKSQGIKSSTEKELERVMGNSEKEGRDDKGQPVHLQKTAAEQPTGDPEAIAALNTVDARNAAAAKRKADAEEQAMAMLAYQHYSRKQQGLSHDAVLAAAWETRMEKAAADGTAVGAPSTVSPENLEELKKSNPELYAKWMALQGGSAPPSRSPSELMAAGGGVRKPEGAAFPLDGSLPPGINPRTGLPDGAGLGLPPDVIYALADDGTPDIARGAVPVQIQYTPPGSTQPVTITKWVRPGYLSGRVRPVDPRIALEEDDAFRRAMKEPTDIPTDTHSAPVAIPYRYTNAKVRVNASDFTFTNRYVVVLPNPKGKLSPPNPPAPRRGGTQ